jgi:hypothetical protein
MTKSIFYPTPPKHARAARAACAARSCKRKAATIKNIQAAINHFRGRLKLSSLDFMKKRTSHVLKGKQQPNYEPPTKELAIMTKRELSEWRAKDRLRRRATLSR